MIETILEFVRAFEWRELVFLLAIFLVAGTIKGFLGIGLPAAAMAFLTLIMPPAEASCAYARSLPRLN